jgi:hypothetical protein
MIIPNCKNNNSLPDLYVHKEETTTAAIVHVIEETFVDESMVESYSPVKLRTNARHFWS